MIIRVRGLKRTKVNLKRYEKKYPEAVREGGRAWGNLLARNLRLAVRPGTRHYWGGRKGLKLYEGIRWEQGKKKFGGRLWMPLHGIALDRQPWHWVSLKRGRIITQWAEEKLGIKGGGILVGPNPWINAIYKKHLKKLKPMIVNKIKKVKRLK